jgi:DNA-binding transcriptional MerR regulator/effector-binding domain-containing protein
MSLFRIGDLARLGGVSVRMLRHYHEIGLLVPSYVDEATGYRSYEAEQLGVLRQIVELKELGLSLAEVESVILGHYDLDGLRTLLGARRREALEEAAAARGRVERIDAHLARVALRESALTESALSEPASPNEALSFVVEVKSVEAKRVAQLTGVAESWAPADIGPVIQPLYPELRSRVTAAGVRIVGPSMAWYDHTAEGRVAVNATLTIDDSQVASSTLGFEIVELPPLDLVASTIHRGTMDNCGPTYQGLLKWIERNGYRSVGHSREVDIECGSDRPWMTELQIPIEPVKESQL